MRHSRQASYHEGELAAQERAGFRDSADHLRAIIDDRLPRGAAGFLAELRFVVVGATAPDGQVWASILYGRPGFLRVLGPREVLVAARLLETDPLAAALANTAQVGTLAIDLPHRRRLRINGRAEAVQDGFRLTVDQAYGNCPKYIQSREPQQAASASAAPHVTQGDELRPEQRHMIDTADTFFVASASTTGDADASHRGGNQGFAHTPTPQRVQWPEYEGNTMLMTLGNLTVNPAAGLLFVDWQSGTTLQVTGTAVIDWSTGAAADIPGAEREVDFHVAQVVQTDLPDGSLIWSAPQFSRFNPPVPPAPPGDRQ
jgi:predicted pyridoxine 5'-phosphate oxidase superfamily flavin-nucleotide-binding protein